MLLNLLFKNNFPFSPSSQYETYRPPPKKNQPKRFFHFFFFFERFCKAAGVFTTEYKYCRLRPKKTINQTLYLDNKNAK